ncbi:MAG: hypothetical protein ACI36X_06130 [Bacteroidaceae bacterium]
MKKLAFLFVAMVAVSFASCCGNKCNNAEAAQADSIRIADSIAAVEAAAAAEAAATEVEVEAPAEGEVPAEAPVVEG